MPRKKIESATPARKKPGPKPATAGKPGPKPRDAQALKLNRMAGKISELEEEIRGEHWLNGQLLDLASILMQTIKDRIDGRELDAIVAEPGGLDMLNAYAAGRKLMLRLESGGFVKEVDGRLTACDLANYGKGENA